MKLMWQIQARVQIMLPLQLQPSAENVNFTASSLQYRTSMVLFDSSVKNEDLVRLNCLGVCMSPDSILRAQNKMLSLLEGKVIL